MYKKNNQQPTLRSSPLKRQHVYIPGVYLQEMQSQVPFEAASHEEVSPPVMKDPVPTSSPFTQFAKPIQPAYEDVSHLHMQDSPQAYQQHESANSATQPNGILNYFHDDNGQFNLDKMLSTVGQMANVYHQVRPIVQQFNALFKSFTAK